MKKVNITGNTYKFSQGVKENLFNNPRFYELKFMPVYEYEKELNIGISQKISMLYCVITYLEKRNIHVTFTDRVLDDIKEWEREQRQLWRYLPIAELQGNNICINPRNIDFLSVFMSLGHIYGHLVQRMNYERYKPITDFLEIPKPMDLEFHFAQYKSKYGRDYKKDFLDFEKEAFSYAKYTFIDAGIKWDSTLEYAMNVYIETDFNELWRWVVEGPLKSEHIFMDEFQRLWNSRKGHYDTMPAKEISVEVIPDSNGSLVVVRNDKKYH